VKEKLLRGLKWAAYPAFYFFALVLFGYLTFPFDRLKDRILSEITKSSKGKGAPQVTIEKLDSYWFSGVELSGVKVRLPAEDASASAPKGFGTGGFGSAGGFGAPAKAEPEKESVIEVPEAHARARLLPLLIGRVQLDFWASVFGGEVTGSAPAGSSKGDVELAISDVKLSEVSPLQNLLGIPIDGKVNGELSLSPLDGKFSKASGKLELSIKGLVVSDGKTKIQGLLAIPAAKVDEIVITGEAEKGSLKITKLSANGPDLELDGDGKINVREPWGDSGVDIYLKFRFTDAYRGKDATTKSILGEPGSTSTPLIEMQVAKLKKAKRADGFYGFHIHGKLKKLDYTPSATEVSSSKKGGKSAGADSPPATPTTGKKMGGLSLPLGPSTATLNKDRAAEKKEEKKEEEEEKKEEPKKEEPREEKNEEKVEDPPKPGLRPIFPPNVGGRREPPPDQEPPPPAPPPEGPPPEARRAKAPEAPNEDTPR
jgi:type II secretion system protein N